MAKKDKPTREKKKPKKVKKTPPAAAPAKEAPATEGDFD
jgi:hypothetical protein